MIITSYSNIDLIQGVIGYGNATEGITDWRLENTGAGVFNIHNSSSIIRPSGGTSEIGQITNSTDRYMIFTAGTSTFTVPAGGIVCDILVVGGGGGGGDPHGGGGGAGQLVFIHQATLNGTYTVKVGNGGIGGVFNSTLPTKGSNSEFGNSTTTVIAEGGGANTNTSSDKNGGSGAGGDGYTSGGGTSGAGNAITTTDLFPTATVYTRGNNGGNNGGNESGYERGGGGGGAGEVGQSGSIGGKGGDGLSGITAINYDFQTNFGNFGKLEADGKYYFAGGGGGGGVGQSGSISSKGGGGVGGIGVTALANLGGNGVANTGSGGGGGGGNTNANGGNGGSGIVIIRYRTTNISIIDNGNVGISTTPISSSSKLEIYGDVNISGNYKLNNRDVLNDTSNYILTTSNLLVPRIITEVGHGSNYVSRINTQLNTRIDDTSNYVAITSSLLANRVGSPWTSISSGIHYTPITSTPVVTTIGATGDYTYMAFTYTTETAGAGTGQTLYTINVPTGGAICDILVVGGGGGGGKRGGGGGGAGACLYHKNVNLNAGTFTIGVGKGGLYGGLIGQDQGGSGSTGSDSSIIYNSTTIYRAKGGGGGQGGSSDTNTSGGSSGGGTWSGVADALSTNNIFNGSAVSVVSNQYQNTLPSPEGCRGNIGGNQLSNYKGGGGGGAGSAGMNHHPETTADDGYGGLGLTIDITGSSIVYAGGGNGSDYMAGRDIEPGNQTQSFNPAYPTIQSRGGGGYGSDSGTAQNGLDGTGGGGGGQGADASGTLAGSGGSGIVIIRFLSSRRNVGIGTTYPTSQLHVFDDTTTNTKLTVQNNYIDDIVIIPNTIGGYTVTETIENNKYYRTLNFVYNVLYPLTSDYTNLIAWYKLDGNLIDSSGVTGSLTGYNGGLLYTQDTSIFSNLPYAYYTNNNIAVNTNWALTPVINNGNVPLTFAFWFRSTSTSTGTMLGYGDKSINGMGIQFDWYLTSGSSYQLSVYTALSNQWTTVPIATGLSLNTWYFCVYTLSKTNSVVVNLYINGTLRDSGSGTAGQTLLYSKTLTIGMSGDGAARGFGGNLADIRIYNKVLSQDEINTLYNVNSPSSIVNTVSFKKSTSIIVNNGAANTVMGRYNISVGPVNSSMFPIDGQAIIPLASTATTSISLKYEYSNTTPSLPALITVAGATSSFIGTTERVISFTYTSDSSGLTGQTMYTFTPTEDLWCDILVVGGGGGGGRFGGGGGGGGVLFGANLKLNSGISVIVKVGNGGAGDATFNDATVGSSGSNSSIIINSIEYIAVGGGGGGSRGVGDVGQNGLVGGSGGGGSGANVLPQGLGGESNKITYTNFQSFGNSGGKGRPNVSGSQPVFSSGGGGGAGSVGSDFSNITGGGNGGQGKNFISYFGTNVGHYGYFAGGGGGQTYVGAGNIGYGNGGLGLYGGGGGGGFDAISEIDDIAANNGLTNTGGGGGGGNNDSGINTFGAKGGSGFVIIRYRKFTTQSASLELITPLSIIEPQTQTLNVESIYPPYRYFTYNDTNGVYTVQNGSIEASDSTNFSYTYSYNDPANTQGNNEQTSSTFKYTHGMGLYTFSVGGTHGGGSRSSGVFIYGLSSDYGSATNGNRPGVNFDDNAALPDGAGWYQSGGWTNVTTYNSSLYYNSSFAGAWIKIEMPVGIVFSSFRILKGPQNRAPKAFKIYGSNTNTTTASDWTLLHTETNYTYTAGGDFGVKQTVNNVLTFKNYLMVVNEITAFDAGTMVFQGWYIYGKEKLEPVVINSDYKYLSFRHNPTTVEQKTGVSGWTVEQKTGVSGWRLVRFLPPTATGWHPINDDLVGTTTYGTAYSTTTAWSIPFGTFDEFVFGTLNLQYWMQITKTQAVGANYSDIARTIIKSSFSATSYSAIQYNRGAVNAEDPWMSIQNHPTQIVYGENSSGVHNQLISVDGGMCVWVRNSADASTLSQSSYSVNFPENTMCDLLVVGGGGGGGYSYSAGGGGGGGYVYLQNISVPSGSYNINVGSGGAGGIDGASPAGWGGNGGNSSITGTINYIALGGGGGAGGSAFNYPTPITGIGSNGGSGGGGTYPVTSGVYPAGGTSTQFSTYGYGNGGNGNPYTSQIGGGGGGASGVIKGSGTGNDGLANSIIGSSITYAGGGGGGNDFTTIYQGGSGGGGAGSNGSGTNVPPVAGTDGLGGGGGGARGGGTSVAAKGGSGIVIIRYRSYKIGNRGYNIGNYNGDFKIVSSTYLSNSQDTDFMRITRDGASIYNPTGSPLWSTVSDRRIKENIEKASYDKCYESINKLELYRFSYIKELNNINKDLKQLGYIAQEVKDIFPKAVSTQEFYNENLSISDMLSIDITQINYSLYGAVKKLIEMYNDIEKQITILENILNIDNTIVNIPIDTSTSNLTLDTSITSNITLDTSITSNLTLDTTTSNITLDTTTSNLTLDTTTSNITLDTTTSNLTLDTITSNLTVDTSITSNLTLDTSTSNLTLDTTTSNVSIDTSTSNLILDTTTSNLIIDTTTSNIALDITTSNLTLDTTTSNITLDITTSNLTLDTTTSNLTLDTTTSNLTLDTTTSNLTLDTTTSNLTLDITTSNITLDTTTSNLTLDTTTSNLTLDTTTSNLTLDTSITSNLTLDTSITSNLTIDTSNSNITLDITTSNLTLDTTTSNITIDTSNSNI